MSVAADAVVPTLSMANGRFDVRDLQLLCYTRYYYFRYFTM